MRTILTCLCLMATTAGSAHAANTITFFRDGSLIRQEAGAVKGVIDIPLASGILEQSLTIAPAPGTTIVGVETRTTVSDSRTAKEIETLTEQRRRLEDRLQALETREAIFTSAAKAQSGKAPRKSKTNPDPMQTIRQGTDFAIAQLEAVYTARRTTTQEIRKIETRLVAAKKSSPPSENSVRIAVTPARGKVTLRYATAEHGWQPQYNLYLEGNGVARLQLSARITGSRRGYQVRVSPASLAENATAETLPVHPDSTLLASYLLPVKEEPYPEGVFNRFSGTIANNTPHYLLPGDSCLFRKGVYQGKFRFEGVSSGRSAVISLGK